MVMQSPAKSALSPARRQLVEMLQSLNFGRIEGLILRSGEPIWAPPPRCIRDLKFGGDNRPRPELAKSDFRLKAEVIELFYEFDRVRDGMILSLEARHGLPARMSIEQSAV